MSETPSSPIERANDREREAYRKAAPLDPGEDRPVDILDFFNAEQLMLVATATTFIEEQPDCDRAELARDLIVIGRDMYGMDAEQVAEVITYLITQGIVPRPS